MSSFTDYQIGQFLAQLDNCYLGLHYADPDLAGAYASELFGGSYERGYTDFSGPSNRGITNLNAQLFAGLPTVTLTHLGGWDAKTKGNMIFSIALTPPVRVKEGGTFSIPSGALVASFD